MGRWDRWSVDENVLDLEEMKLLEDELENKLNIRGGRFIL